jgi:hypothetical protein
MKLLTIYTCVWGVLLALLFVFSAPLVDKLWLLYLAIHWGVALAGGTLLVFAVVRAFRELRPALPTLLITTLGLCLFFTSGFRLGRLAYFQIKKPHYEHLLAEAQDSGAVPNGEGYIDSGQPARYAFFWVRGVVDNWVGVVYDPTGVVMNVNQASGWDDLRDPRWAEAVNLFGGTLYKTERLEGHWYLCWFT